MAATKEEPVTEVLLSVEHVALPHDATIYQRMNQILAELPAIGKTEYNEQQKFHFRGHDAVLNALNPLLAKHGVFVIPEVLERTSDQRTTGRGSTMYEVNLHMRFTFYGLAGDSVVGSTWGEGTDMGDKATNKAMTMAFKAVLAQAFSVSTAESYDTDGQTNEETTRGAAARAAREPVRPKVKLATGWTDWTTRMAALGVTPEDSAEWLREAAANFDVSTDEGKTTLFQKANRVLVALTEKGDQAFNTDARAVLQEIFAAVFDGLAVAGPPWRVSPTEESLPSYDEYQEASGETGPGQQPDGYDPEIGF